jgi:hypothetical protein
MQVIQQVIHGLRNKTLLKLLTIKLTSKFNSREIIEVPASRNEISV